MSQIIGPPPPLGPGFDEKVNARITAHRRRRRAGTLGATLLVVAVAGAAFGLSTANGHGPVTKLRAAGSTHQASTLPDPAPTNPSTTTTPSTLPVPPPPSTSAVPVTAPATVPPVTAPPVSEPPSTAPPTTTWSCPDGVILAAAVVHATRKGTDANGTPTWFVSATATVTNYTPATVDLSMNAYIVRTGGPLALDPPTAVVTVLPGASQTFPLDGVMSVAPDGSNAVNPTAPTEANLQAGVLRRWHDDRDRAQCTPPGAVAAFELFGPWDPTPEWPWPGR